MGLRITTTAFDAGARMPEKYTGEGVDVSPALEWTGVPAGTQELALIVDDPDAPRPEPWVHWVIAKIPADATGLPEGVPREEKLSTPAGAVQGVNSWPDDNIGYRGPMPPTGHGAHHYHFKLYALDAKLDVPAGLTKAALLEAMQGHIVAEAEVIGTYAR
jgi:Raf kinase inhibitor-like YbhB/YbcL family protein